MLQLPAVQLSDSHCCCCCHYYS